MSHLYDTIEPNIISEGLLRKCVLDQGPDGEAGRIAKDEGIDFGEVTQLRLDFQNILRIENLWQFTSLRKLQLDNNIIEDITGLSSLVHLEWLDLSFNNVAVITGLEKLVKLKDLSLAHNRITTVENVDSLVNLQVLSLANNLMESMENIKYLRSFSKLQTLSLKGNPLATDESYHSFVIAFIPSLVYLDFKMVMDEEREEAKKHFIEDLREIEQSERDAARRRETQRLIEEKNTLYQSAYVDGLEDTALFVKLFEEDNDAGKFKHLPGLPEMLETYEVEFVKCCNHLVKVGLEERKKRLEEVTDFEEAHKTACRSNQELSVERVKEYESLKQTLLPDGMITVRSRQSGDSVIQEMTKAIDGLLHDLMRLEMQLVEQLDEVTKDFELNYSDMMGGFKEQVQSHMTQLRDLENAHHEALTEIGTSVFEKFTKKQLEEEPHEDLRVLFVDKDTLVSAINTAHDTHMLAIDSREDIISQQTSKDMSDLITKIQDAEVKRNRQKVLEIDLYIENQREELGALEMSTPNPQ